jgi:hypothetical protein
MATPQIRARQMGGLAWSSETTGDCEGPVRAHLTGLGMVGGCGRVSCPQLGCATTSQKHSIAGLGTSTATLQVETRNMCGGAPIQHMSVPWALSTMNAPHSRLDLAEQLRGFSLVLGLSRKAARAVRLWVTLGEGS